MNLFFGALIVVLAVLAWVALWIAMGGDVVRETQSRGLPPLPLRIKAKLWLSLPLTMKDEQWMDRAIAEAELEKSPS